MSKTHDIVNRSNSDTRNRVKKMSKVAMWKVFGAFVGLSVVIFVWVGIAVTAEWHPMVLAAGCAFITLTGGSLIAIIAIDSAKRCYRREVKRLKAKYRKDLLQSRIAFIRMLPAFQAIGDGYDWSRGPRARFAFARWMMNQVKGEKSNVAEWVECLQHGETIVLSGILNHMNPEDRYGVETQIRAMVLGALAEMRLFEEKIVSQDPDESQEPEADEPNEAAAAKE